MNLEEMLKALLTGYPPPEEVLEEILPTLRWVCLEPVASPTRDQMEALRSFEPFDMQNLLQARRALIDGAARLGPWPENDARTIADAAFTPCGVAWHLVVPTEDELRQEGLCH